MSTSPEPAENSPDPRGISLDELSQAYANAIDTGNANSPSSPSSEQNTPDEAEKETPQDESEPLDELPEITSLADAESDDDPCPLAPDTILEVMLFVGNRQSEPLAPARAAGLMRGVEPAEISQLVDQLNQHYTTSGCPYRIVGDGAGYRLVLRRKFDPVRNKFYGRAREARLSQAAVDVLAILAYRQPLTSEDVNRLRGTPSGHVLSQLVRRQLLRIERVPGKRKKNLYHTTNRFLELFGMEHLDELPQAEDPEPR